MLIAERRSWRSQAFCTGVWPDGAHVRRRTGWSMKPLSSKKTRGVSVSRAPFLSAANPACATCDGVVVRLSRLLLGFLTGPAKVAENLPDVAWMVANPKLLGNDCRDCYRSKDRCGSQPFAAPLRGISATSVFEQRSIGAGPGCGLAFSASMPPIFRARFQRFTEDLEAPTISITSPIVLPSSRSCPASRRRVSNSAALPCFLINYYTHGHTTWFIYQAKVNKKFHYRSKGGWVQGRASRLSTVGDRQLQDQLTLLNVIASMCGGRHAKMKIDLLLIGKLGNMHLERGLTVVSGGDEVSSTSTGGPPRSMRFGSFLPVFR